MKTLIFKSKIKLTDDEKKYILENMHDGLRGGVVFIDGTEIEYEVVEFDSLEFDPVIKNGCILPKKKSRRDIMDHNERMNKFRETLREKLNTEESSPN